MSQENIEQLILSIYSRMQKCIFIVLLLNFLFAKNINFKNLFHLLWRKTSNYSRVYTHLHAPMEC